MYSIKVRLRDRKPNGKKSKWRTETRHYNDKYSIVSDARFWLERQDQYDIKRMTIDVI